MGLIPSDDQFGPIILLHSRGGLGRFEASKCISSQPTSTCYLVSPSLLIEHIHQNHFVFCYVTKCSVNGALLNAFSSVTLFEINTNGLWLMLHSVVVLSVEHFLFRHSVFVPGECWSLCFPPPQLTVSLTPRSVKWKHFHIKTLMEEVETMEM